VNSAPTLALDAALRDASQWTPILRLVASSLSFKNPRANPRRDWRAALVSFFVVVAAIAVVWIGPAIVDTGASVVGGVGGVIGLDSLNASRARRRRRRGKATGPREMPPYFRDGVSLRRAEAQWATTLKWREENGMDEILSSYPEENGMDYDIITKAFPWHIHLRDREKNLVSIERFGTIDFDTLKRRGPFHFQLSHRDHLLSTALYSPSDNSLTHQSHRSSPFPTTPTTPINLINPRRHRIGHDQLIRHYQFQIEWLWTVAAPKDEDQITMIMDIADITWDQVRDMGNMAIIKDRIKIGCEHYPNRAAVLIMANIPPWANAAYQFVSPLLSPATKSKLVFMTPEMIREGALTKYIAPANLPSEYGGSSKVALGQSETDKKQRRMVQSLTKAASKKGRRKR